MPQTCQKHGSFSEINKLAVWDSITAVAINISHYSMLAQSCPTKSFTGKLPAKRKPQTQKIKSPSLAQSPSKSLSTFFCPMSIELTDLHDLGDLAEIQINLSVISAPKRQV